MSPWGRSIDLASGLMEIAYDTGAKVILQGPVTYSVEANGGYLTVGKLTGKLERKAEGGRGKAEEAGNQKSPFPFPPSPFVVRTPTATVTDLGTEFGIEVKQNGVSEIHLLQGQVNVRRVDADDAAHKGVNLSRGQAVRVSRTQPGYTFISAAAAPFVNMRTPLVKTPPPRWPLLDKTLVAWVSLANLDQRGVGLFSVVNLPRYDGIVFGEREPRKWMAGSCEGARSQGNQSTNATETAGPGELVQIAIVYNWMSVTTYRNGEKYAQHDTDSRQTFDADSILVIGRRLLGTDVVLPTLAGAVEEARLYNVALSPKIIASLKPNEPSPIGPVGLWTFEDGTARDSTGHFPMGLLQGKARIADGKLILDGRESFLVVPAIGGIKEPTRPLQAAISSRTSHCGPRGSCRVMAARCCPPPRCFPA